MTENILSTLLLSLQDRKLILPENLVVEITPLSDLIIESHQEPWMLGYKHWRNMRIPVISLESMTGGTMKKHSHNARVAILKRSGENQAISYWGALVQGAPEKMMVSQSDIFSVDDKLSEVEQLSVQVKGVAARILDFVGIEQRIATACSAR